MKRLVPLALLGAVALASVAATCVVRNESLTEIDGRDTFAGELHNDSGVDILFHEYRVSFLDEDLDLLETRTAQGCLRSLQDGAVDFFSAASTEDADDTEIALGRLANFAEDPDFEIGQVEDSDIAFTAVTAARVAGTLTVAGTITNNDSDELEDPAVCAVVYNNDGRVVTTAKDSDINSLDEGESDAFAITIKVPDDADLVDEVDVWADGLEDGVPVEPASSVGLDVSIGTAVPTSTATAVPTSTPTP